MSNSSSAQPKANAAAVADRQHRPQEFLDGWLAEQNHLLQLLISASGGHENSHYYNDTQLEEERLLIPLIHRFVVHQESLYAARSRWAAEDALATLSPSWTNSLESAFLWIGGWRPGVVFHLLFSKLGLQVESRMEDLCQGLRTRDLADISPDQLVCIDRLQRTTQRKEREISEKMAKQQEGLASAAMVELSHLASESLRTKSEGGNGGAERRRRVESELGNKEEGFMKIMGMADELRMRTMRTLLDMLTPIQAVHFLIAGAELRLRVHDWGTRRRDCSRGDSGSSDGRGD